MKVIITAILILAIINVAPAQLNSDFDQLIEASMNEIGATALSVAIVSEKEILWKKSYGHLTRQKLVEANASTGFILSSIGKLFVATAVMQLKENGKIALDEDISSYLPFTVRNPKFPEDQITVRHLLNHQSGLANGAPSQLPTGTQLITADTILPFHPWIEEVLVPGSDIYNERLWMPVKPGELTQSSNMGMTLLSYLVEAVSGKKFGDYVDEHIFDPLEMYNTDYTVKDIQDSVNRVTLYPGNRTLDKFMIRIYPAGALWSNIEDLGKFMRAIINGGETGGTRILSESSVEEMTSITIPVTKSRYGLGYIWRGYHENEWIGHTGAGGLATSIFVYHPDKKVGLIILSNAAAFRAIRPEQPGKIYDALLKEALRLTD